MIGGSAGSGGSLMKTPTNNVGIGYVALQKLVSPRLFCRNWISCW